MNKTIPDEISKQVNRVKNFLSGEEGILATILEDHKPLKELIRVMKDLEKPFEERERAFMDFAPLLLTHAKAEEESLYAYLKTVAELKTEGFEGQAEHNIADQLCEEIKRTDDRDALSARIKVLAELVEHHIEEEENVMFPEIRARVPSDVLMNLNNEYVEDQSEIIAEGQDDAPHEAELTENPKH